MKTKKIMSIILVVICVFSLFGNKTKVVEARNDNVDCKGIVYEFDKKDSYEIGKGKKISRNGNLISINGKYQKDESKNGKLNLVVQENGELIIAINEHKAKELNKKKKKMNGMFRMIKLKKSME